MICLRLRLLAVFGVVMTMPLAAQERSPVSLEASFGVGSGRSERTYRDRTAPVIDAMLTWRIRPDANGAILLGLSVGGHGVMTGVTSDCILMPDGGCMAPYPAFHSLGLLVGREWRRWAGSSVRALAGPALYRADWRSGGGRTGGLQGRVDIASPPVWRVALLGSVRGAVLPGYRRERHTLGAIGLGIRLQ
jgi:hypothetical protein